MIDHRSYIQDLNMRIRNGIRSHNLCDTGAVLYQLSPQANWGLVSFW